MVGKIRVQFTLFLLCDKIGIGGVMKIAVDDYSVFVAKNGENEYIYLYDDKSIDELEKLHIHCLKHQYCDYVDINLTDYNVECLKKAKITDKDWNIIHKKQNKIAIIIPNYNYSHTIEKCLNSILKQTYTNYEIIFVDDCSTDNSVEIAKKLLKPPHKVVELKQKRLNGGARNEAYLYVSDDTDYIWYVDSDDWLYDNNALEYINNKLQSNPDVLFVGMASYSNNLTRTCFIPDYRDKYEALKGWSGSCGKVIKKSLATRPECLYKEGTLKEDRTQHRKICIYMKNFALLKKPVYVWNRENPISVTTTRNNLWKTSTIRHYADTLELYLNVKGKDKELDKILEEAVEKTKKEVEKGDDQQW